MCVKLMVLRWVLLELKCVVNLDLVRFDIDVECGWYLDCSLYVAGTVVYGCGCILARGWLY